MMNNIIDKLITATHLIDQAEEVGLSNEVKIDEGGLSITVCRSVSGSGYYLTGYFMPEAVEEPDPELYVITDEEGTENDLPFC